MDPVRVLATILLIIELNFVMFLLGYLLRRRDYVELGTGLMMGAMGGLQGSIFVGVVVWIFKELGIIGGSEQ